MTKLLTESINMSDITIIIPTYNRPDYLKRILSYYNDAKGGFEFVVADSSSDENKKKNKETVKSFQNLSISYLAGYPDDINPWYKFEDALQSVHTKYAVFCGDDDFVTPNGIKQVANFLEENSDFAVAHGNYIGFFAEKNAFAWKVAGDFKSIEFPEAQKRMSEHLSNYSISTFYGAHRTDFLKMIFEEIRKFTNDNRFGELLPSILTLIYGKMKKIDILYAAHEINPKSTGLVTDTLYDFKKANTFGEKYDNFKNCLADHLVKNSELELDGAKIAVDKAMSAYFEKNYPENLKTFLKDKIKEIIVYLPMVRNAYIALNFSKMRNISKDTLQDIEFQKIKSCVESYKVKKS